MFCFLEAGAVRAGVSTMGTRCYDSVSSTPVILNPWKWLDTVSISPYSRNQVNWFKIARATTSIAQNRSRRPTGSVSGNLMMFFTKFCLSEASSYCETEISMCGFEMPLWRINMNCLYIDLWIIELVLRKNNNCFWCLLSPDPMHVCWVFIILVDNFALFIVFSDRS